MQNHKMNDDQLDAALDALKSPVPSDTLVHRVHVMAPPPQKVFMTPRRLAAAALIMALGAATRLHMANSNSIAPTATPGSPAPIAAVADPAGEISVSDLALGDEVTISREPLSMAGMPLE
jgi:hypothetical protein